MVRRSQQSNQNSLAHKRHLLSSRLRGCLPVFLLFARHLLQQRIHPSHIVSIILWQGLHEACSKPMAVVGQLDARAPPKLRPIEVLKTSLWLLVKIPWIIITASLDQIFRKAITGTWSENVKEAVFIWYVRNYVLE